MKESTEVSCNCYGPFSVHQQKLFLTRKRDHDDQEPLFSARRINKSAQLKTDSQGKPLKKSLKKRPGSAFGADSHAPTTPIDSLRLEIDPKGKAPEQSQLKNKQNLHRGHETPLYMQQIPISHVSSIRFPETTVNSRPMPFHHNQKEQTFIHASNFQNPFQQASTQPYHPRAVYQEKPVGPLRPQLQQFRNETAILLNASPSFSQDFKGHMMTDLKGKQVISKQTLVPHEVYYSAQLQQPRKESKGNKDAWTIDEENLMIEGFDRLLKPREENKSHDHLNREPKHQHPREVQMSKRLEKQQQQQFFGRFAESDGEDSNSESPPSEVIGRGFDRTYQDMLDDDHDTLHQQTKASRSTNTKVSELHMGEKRLSEHHTPGVFGTATHFKSYKFL